MKPVYLIDGVRTPIGSFGGSLADVRADDLAAHVIAQLVERHPDLDPSAHRRRHPRLRQPGGRRQSQRRAHGAAPRGTAGLGARRDGQPALRIGHERGRERRASRQAGRRRRLHRRRRRAHDARTVRDVQSEPAFARNVELFDTSLGWRFVNPEDARALRHRLDGADRGERRRAVRGHARGSGRVRAVGRSRRPRRHAALAASQREIVPVTIPPPEGRAGRRVRAGRVPSAGHDDREARRSSSRRFAPTARDR